MFSLETVRQINGQAALEEVIALFPGLVQVLEQLHKVDHLLPVPLAEDVKELYGTVRTLEHLPDGLQALQEDAYETGYETGYSEGTAHAAEEIDADVRSMAIETVEWYVGEYELKAWQWSDSLDNWAHELCQEIETAHV